MPKQQSISSFFRPKNSQEQPKPKVSKNEAKVKTEEKENLAKALNEVHLEKKRRVIVDSSDEDEKPAKRQKSMPLSSSDSDDEEEPMQRDDDDDASDSGSGLDSEASSAISESELDFLKKDAAEMEAESGPCKRRANRRKSPKKKRAVLASDSESDEEPDKPEKNKVKNKVEEKVAKTESTKERKETVKKEPFPFEEPSSSQEDTKPSPKKKSPKTKKPKKEVKEESSTPPPKSNKNKQKGPVKVTEFDPSQANYDPVNDACWAMNDPVPYYALAKTLALCEENSGRLLKTSYLANFLLSVDTLSPDDLLPAVHLSLNLLAAAYEGFDLKIFNL